jgi:hypothetical protein
MSRQTIGRLIQSVPARLLCAFAHNRGARQLFLLAGATVFSLVMWQVASATTITQYEGPFPGTTVIYAPHFDAASKYVTEASQNPLHPTPLFGPPTVTGNSIDFNPTGFGAFGANGSADLNDGQLVFEVAAKPNNAINSISFAEAGITTLFGSGTDATMTTVQAKGNVDIYQVDGVPINKISVPLTMTFAPKADGTFKLVSDAGLGLNALPWNGNALVLLDSALTSAGVHFTKGATLISVDLDNVLTARSENGTFALIDKKDFGGVSITINPGEGGGPDTPEPASLVLACLGLLGLVGVRRLGR